MPAADPASPVPAVPAIFSAARRRGAAARRRALIARGGTDADIIGAEMAAALADRLAMVTRRFADAVLIGDAPDALAAAVSARAQAVSAVGDDEAALLALAPAAHDLIVWPGGLALTNDVPGVLMALRRALRPDGLLLGAMAGDGSHAVLRRMLAGPGMRGAARMHPQIDVGTMGHLLQRAGFALPVVDVDALALGYRGWRAVVRDLRAAGLASQLASAPPPLTRAELAALDAQWAALTGPDGRLVETARLVHFSGWAPAPGQPAPARRGSGRASLAAALRAK